MSAIQEIKEDLSNLKAVLATFDEVIEAHVDNLRIDGRTYMQANVQQATYSGYYDQYACELQVMFEDMKLRIKVAQAKALRTIKETSPEKHAEKVLNMMIEGDALVVKTNKAMLEVRERMLKMQGIVDAFNTRGFAINNMIKARVAEFHNEMMYVND